MESKKKLSLITYSGQKIFIIWDSYIEEKNQISILNYIDKNSKIIRKEYVDLIEKIAFFKINNQNLFEIFTIEKNFSIWWTTEIYEKSLYKQENINEILKLIAFEKIIKSHKINKIIVSDFPLNISKSIKEIAKLNKIIVEEKSKKNTKLNFNYFKIIFNFFNFIRFILSRFSLTKTNVKDENFKNLFCSYFAYIDQNCLKKGEYRSSYWGDLLKNNIINKSCFAHIFFPSKKISYSRSIKLLKKVNCRNSNKHFFVEEFFSLKIFFKIIFHWITNMFKYAKNKNIIETEFEKKNIPTSYLLSEKLEEELYGVSSLISFYYFFLFKEINKTFKNLRKTFFLYENQGWEKSFVYNLKKNDLNKIYAVQNSTVRFWDLRFSKNNNQVSKFTNQFEPNFYLVNGNDSFEKFIENGYPIKKIKHVEAIRYFELMKFINLDLDKNIKKNSVLVIGDYSDKSNMNIAKSINNLDKFVKNNFKFSVKEHPLRKMSKYLKIEYDKTELPIEKLINEYEFAIVGNTTSAAIDLYLLGSKLIIILDQNVVNLSPLKDVDNVFFLGNYLKLKDALLNYNNKGKLIDKKKTNFFNYNPNYDLWNNLINNEN